MPTNRRPLQRQRQPSSFARETLELFLELEHTPARRRRADTFKAKQKRLMQLLNMSIEWWGGCSVLDRSSAPCWTPTYAGFYYWHRCREVRTALLAATGGAVSERRDKASRQSAPH